MTYSVWDPASRMYDYYATPAAAKDVEVPSSKHLRGDTPIGLPAEGAAWPLPANAKRIGRGRIAKGMIASRGGSALSGPTDSVMNLGVGALVAIGVVLYLVLGARE